MAYIGQSLTEGTRRVYTYVATASQTTFNAVYGVGAVDVYQNGVLLQPSDYTATNGTSVVLDTGAALSDEITIVCHNTFSVADTVSASQGGTFNNDITVSGDLTVDANTLHVDSANNRVGVMTGSPTEALDVAGNVRIGPYNTADEYQGLLLQSGKDSSAATSTSFIDARNNLGIPDGHIFFRRETDGSSAIMFGTTPAGSRSSDRRQERMRILPTGGITFNGDTAQDNALNDYEEGTWNAFWTNQYGQTIFDQSPSAQMSRYTKVGDTVHATAYFSMPAAFGPTAAYVAGAALRIGGLPFTSSRQGGSDYYAGAVGWYQSIASYAAGYTPMIYVESGTTTIPIVFANGSYVSNFAQSNAYSSNSGMIISVSYKTAS